jgi:protein CpxP
MKLIKLTLVGALLFSSAAFGQETKKVKSETRMDELTKELSLTPDQAKKLEAANNKLTEAKKEAKSNESLSEDARKKAIKNAKESFKSELATFLSEDQLTKMKELHEAKNTDKPEKTPEQRAEAQTKKMTEELNLTEDQQKQVMELNLKVEHKIQAIKNDDSMSDEKKKKFIAGNKKDKRNALSAILTADQMEILNAKKDEKKSEKK